LRRHFASLHERSDSGTGSSLLSSPSSSSPSPLASLTDNTPPSHLASLSAPSNIYNTRISNESIIRESFQRALLNETNDLVAVLKRRDATAAALIDSCRKLVCSMRTYVRCIVDRQHVADSNRSAMMMMMCDV
jgi:hypothetical protein